jgi:hypothetical protein
MNDDVIAHKCTESSLTSWWQDREILSVVHNLMAREEKHPGVEGATGSVLTRGGTMRITVKAKSLRYEECS